ncbi:MAG: recombinase family protein [Eubacteriales bacterium]|jgi:site-specific DNA recombinase
MPPSTALYIRVSTEEQALQGLSLETQRAALTEYAQKHELPVIGIFADEGISARKPYTSRPALLQLLELVEQDQVQLILFTKLDRWFRSIPDYYKVQERLDAHRVHWRTILEQYDTSTAAGRLHVNIMLSVAQDEADRTSERIRAVFQQKMARGEALSGRVPPGYRLQEKHIVLDPETQPLVRALFSQLLICRSPTLACQRITEQFGRPFDPRTLRRMVRNPLYQGELHGMPNSCPAYLTPDERKTLLCLLEGSTPRRSTAQQYLFSGLLLCDVCASPLACVTQRRTNSTGEHHYHYYRCSRHWNKHLCSNAACPFERSLEQQLLQWLSPHLDGLPILPQPFSEAPSPSLSAVRKQQTRLRTLYLHGMLEWEEFNRQYRQLHDKLSRPSWQPPPPPQDWKALYHTLSLARRSQFWHCVLQEVRITSEKELLPRLRKDWAQ